MWKWGLLPVWPRLFSATGRGEVMRREERRWLNHNRWINEARTFFFSRDHHSKMFASSHPLPPIISSPEGSLEKRISPPCGHLRKRLWGIAAAATDSLWMQLSVKQTPTCHHQRTISPLTTARLLQNCLAFCCPALLWPGKGFSKETAIMTNKQSSLSITWRSRLLYFARCKLERSKQYITNCDRGNKKVNTYTRARTGRTSHKNSGSLHTGRSCHTGGQGGHTADSCTPDWTSYLEQQRTKPSECHSELCCMSECFFIFCFLLS